MINTSNSGMMSSSSHILRHYDFTLLVMISKESMLEYTGRKAAASLTSKCTLVPNMWRMIFRQQGAVEDHIKEREHRISDRNTTFTIKWFLQNQDTIS